MKRTIRIYRHSVDAYPGADRHATWRYRGRPIVCGDYDDQLGLSGLVVKIEISRRSFAGALKLKLNDLMEEVHLDFLSDAFHLQLPRVLRSALKAPTATVFYFKVLPAKE